MSRSPRKKPARNKLTVLVQTHVTPEVGRMVRDRLGPGMSESAYLRSLIHRDLGLLTLTTDDKG